MAAQASHVVYADKALKTILKGRKVNEKDYFLGTLFPDIRYLAKIDRNLTHFSAITVDNLVSAKSDFELGMLVHSLVDTEREKIIGNTGIYSSLPTEIGIYTFVKLVEEIYTYPIYENWVNITDFLNDVLVDETRFISEASVRQWHSILRDFFTNAPTTKSLLKFAEAIGIKKEATALYAKYGHLANNVSLISAIKSIYPSLFAE